MATARVFDIIELLEIIVCQVDAHQIPELKLVNKTWCDVITSSEAVRRAQVLLVYRALDPYDKNDMEFVKGLQSMTQDDLAEWAQNRCSISDVAFPHYRSDDWPRVNPRLTKVHAEKYSSGEQQEFFEVHIRLSLHTEANMLDCLEDFVTEPPCHSISLGYWCWDEDESKWLVTNNPGICWAYNPEGLRIKDILRVRDQVIETCSKFARDDYDQVDEVVAHLLIHTKWPMPQHSEDVRLCASYSDGPLPRYRKASHRLGPEGVKAYLKDQELQWDPSMDVFSKWHGW